MPAETFTCCLLGALVQLQVECRRISTMKLHAVERCLGTFSVHYRLRYT